MVLGPRNTQHLVVRQNVAAAGGGPPKWPVGTPTARYALCLSDTPTPKSVQTKILIIAQKYYIKFFTMVSQSEVQLQEQLITEHLKKLNSAEKGFIPFVRHVWPDFISGYHHKKIAKNLRTYGMVKLSV